MVALLAATSVNRGVRPSIKRNHGMKFFVTTLCVLACIGGIAVTFAQDTAYFNTQGEVMGCSPPKFLLVSDVDLVAKTITGMTTIERRDPNPSILAAHRQFNLSDVQLTDARRSPIKDDELKKLKGKLIVIAEGKGPLSATYLGLFREDTVVLTIPETK